MDILVRLSRPAVYHLPATIKTIFEYDKVVNAA